MKKLVLILCVMMAAALLSGCALVEKDTEVDMATPIVSLGDTTFTKAQVLNNVYYYEYLYSMYGMTGMDRGALIDDVIEGLKGEAVQQHMIKELKLDELTAEDEAAIEEKAQAALAEAREEVLTHGHESTAGLEGDALEAAIDEDMTAHGYTLEAFKEQEKNTLLHEKLNAYVTDAITVTDEEVKANYDTLVANAKANYETSPTSFGSNFNAGSQIYYTPAGYRNIKNLLVKFTDEDAAAISDLNTQISGKNSEITALQTEIDAHGEAEEGTEPEAHLQEDQAALAALQTEAEDLNAKLDAAKATAYTNIGDTIAEIREKLAAGEAFEALMDEYGKDTVAVNLSTGYAVCEGFTGKSAEWMAAAMALEKAGDVTSEDVKMTDGISILYYAADLQEGAVDFETVKDLDAVRQLKEKKEEAYTAQVQEWLKANPVKVDRKAMDN